MFEPVWILRKQYPVDGQLDLEHLSRKCDGLTPAAIVELYKRAALRAVTHERHIRDEDFTSGLRAMRQQVGTEAETSGLRPRAVS